MCETNGLNSSCALIHMDTPGHTHIYKHLHTLKLTSIARTSFRMLLSNDVEISRFRDFVLSQDGSTIFFDRNPDPFTVVLDVLRTGKVCADKLLS